MSCKKIYLTKDFTVTVCVCDTSISDPVSQTDYAERQDITEQKYLETKNPS